MDPAADLFTSVFIRFFFLLTPFFVISSFLSMTREIEGSARRGLALRVTVAVVLVCLVLYFFGNAIFRIFGITLDAFRVGAGALLFLSAVDLVRGGQVQLPDASEGDIAVVPLAIPITVGPATTGALLVMGAEARSTAAHLTGLLALAAAGAAVGGLLMIASAVERVLGRRGLTILSKLTGLILAAIAAQMVLSGVRGFWG